MKTQAKEQRTQLQEEIEKMKFNLTQNECALNDQLDKLNQSDKNSNEYEQQEINVAKLQDKINSERNELRQKQQEFDFVKNNELAP